jgi:hypothetical protein
LSGGKACRDHKGATASSSGDQALLHELGQYPQSSRAQGAGEDAPGQGSIFAKVYEQGCEFAHIRRLPGGVRQCRERAPQALSQNGVLSREVLVERGAADTRPFDDVVDLDVFITPIHGQVKKGLEQCPTGSGGAGISGLGASARVWGFDGHWNGFVRELRRLRHYCTAGEKTEYPHYAMKSEPLSSGTARPVGIALIVAALLEVAVMMHHPTARMPEIAQTIAHLRELTSLSAWVHGLLIGLMLVAFYGLTEFSLWRGIRRPPIRAALIAYAFGVVAMIMATTVSGFVTAEVAARVPATTATDLSVAGGLLTLCGVLNRATANLATMLMSAAIVIWSLDLFRPAWFERVLGVLGMALGVWTVVALATGALQLDVHGMLLVVVLQSVWVAGVGLLLVKAS